MKKGLKWAGITLIALLGMLLVAGLFLSVRGAARFARTQDIQVEQIAIPDDDMELARGEHLVQSSCVSCHGADLTGQPLLEIPPIGMIYAANLTGLAETHSDADLVRAIRHAVDQDGRQLAVMPAESFIHFSAEDLGAIIAYLKTVRAAGDPSPQPRLTVLGQAMMGAGVFGNFFPAEYIDHEQPFPARPPIGANPEYGAYLSGLCSSCHGAALTGSDQLADPSSPPAPNLTPGGRLSGWSEEEFLNALQTGQTPDGRVLDPRFMPWDSFGKLDEAELLGLWMYLQTLPPRVTGDNS